jgi:phosphoribosylanthranilate isomerase
MSRIKIKICGNTEPGNMMQLAELKPDFMGYIFFPLSPRDVSAKIEELPLQELPKEIKTIAVTVNKPLEETIGLVEKYNFNMIQLHGNEDPDYCRKLRQYAQVIKVFHVADALPEQMGDFETCCDYFLFDTQSQLQGGSGKSFHHQILENLKTPKPWFLGGGISPEFNPGKIHPQPFALDINSRFETSPGVKNVEQVREFIQKIRQADLQS